MPYLGYQNVIDYGVAPKISSGEMLKKSLFLPVQESALFVENIVNTAFGKEIFNDRLRDVIELSNYQLSKANTTGQIVGNDISYLAGMILDPISWSAGLGLGKVVGLGLKGASKVLPEYIAGLSGQEIKAAEVRNYFTKDYTQWGMNKYARFLPKNLSETITKPIEDAAIFGGYNIPRNYNANYDPKTFTLDKSGFISSTMIDGGIGLAFKPIFWAAASIQQKIFGNAKVARSPRQKLAFAEDALNKGKITKEEHNWYKNLIEHPEKENEHLKGSFSLLKKDGHTINVMTGKIVVPYITKDELEKMQSLFYDQAFSEVEPAYQNAATHFVAHEIIDRHIQMVRDHPTMMGIIKENINYLDGEFKRHNQILKNIDNYFEEKISREEDYLTPEEYKELSQLKKNFSSKIDLSFKNLERLRELAEKNKEGEKLIAQLHAKESLAEQKAYADFYRGVIKAAESALYEKANPENLITYLKQKIEGKGSIPAIQEEMERSDVLLKERTQSTASVEEKSLDDNFRKINENENISSEHKDDFNKTYERIRQFQGSKEAQENLIKCVTEAANVII